MEKKQYILDKAMELAKEIRQSKEYQDYLNVSVSVEENRYLQYLISDIVALQKDLVHMEDLNIDTSEMEEKLETLNKRLYTYPLYEQYLSKVKIMDDLNRKIEEKILMAINN